jgi:hypothetical protein
MKNERLLKVEGLKVEGLKVEGRHLSPHFDISTLRLAQRDTSSMHHRLSASRSMTL